MNDGRPRSRSGNDPSRPNPQRTWCGRTGSIGLLAWLAGGIVLEGLHGFKFSVYLEDGMRRQMWTLAHAHGTLLSLASIVLAWAGPLGSLPPARARWCDRLFAAGAVMLPLGFLLGGMWHSEADPGIGILLVPAGGFVAAAGLIAWVAAPESSSHTAEPRK
jgi:hypothetical protein